MLVTEKYELKLRSAAAPAVQPSMINAIHLISIREAYRVNLWIEICPIKNSVIHLFGNNRGLMVLQNMRTNEEY